ncbi:FAD-dependent oxidoreductase [Stygiolobus caldivivus]|uniref:FAD-dependent oxidoreductase n=1 Tax=Stygiolobus caldivivus TaxID=2824673 RepID=A0A8D5U900_9CREN|nr:FAD-dependent oxidoreductase [Stygiolobus caldivivus]BCU71442.1 FAD-dependent oxidoreductase [Stygiolobus caldivivus]
MKVAIVGGGIVGLFTAYYLSKENVDVTVFEKAFLGNGSVHAAGLIEPYRFDKINSLSMIKKMMKYRSIGVTNIRSVNANWLFSLIAELNKPAPPEAWEIMRFMASYSLKEYKRMAEERNDFDYEENGLLELYYDKSSLEKAVEEEKGNPFRPKFEVTDVKGFAGGIYFPELSKVDTFKFINRMERELDNVRVIIKEVKKVGIDGTLEGAKYDRVVLASGVSLRNLGLPITAFKGYGYRVKGEVEIKYPFVLAEYGVAVAKNSDHIKITGGFDADFSEDSNRAEFFLGVASKVVGVNYVYDLTMGYRPCSPDGFPIIGEYENLVFSTGACRLGWSFAPAMGKMTSDMVLGRAKSYGYLSRYISGRNLRVDTT